MFLKGRNNTNGNTLNHCVWAVRWASYQLTSESIISFKLNQIKIKAKGKNSSNSELLT